jgi:uncharacterized protein
MQLYLSVVLLCFALCCPAQHTSDTTFMGWPEKVHSITYRTYGVPDSLIAFHENGKIKNKVRYSNGKVEGQMLSWFNTGKIFSSVSMKQGKANGEALFYYPGGNLKSKGTHIDNKREGVFTWYDSTGYKKVEIPYHAGKREGKAYRFYSNGNISSRMHFKNGIKEDSVVDYYISGKIKLIRSYKKGRMKGERIYFSEDGKGFDGDFVSYYENGLVERECKCVNGRPEGLERTFTTKGKKIKVANYKDGFADGEVMYYDLNEQVILTETYRKGKFKKAVKVMDSNTRVDPDPF